MNKIDKITQIVGQKFRSFGGGHVTPCNPVSEALKDQPFQFAAGVDIKAVVETVLDEAAAPNLLDACKTAKEAVYAAINGDKSKLSHVWHDLEQAIAKAKP